MYLTAQRVMDEASEHEGVNAFYFVHGGEEFDRATPRIAGDVPGVSFPDPTHAPGRLRREAVTLPAGGNRVRSYLDIVCADGTPASAIRRAFAVTAAAMQPTSLPFTAANTACLFRFGVEQSLAHRWRDEMLLLFELASITYQQEFSPP